MFRCYISETKQSQNKHTQKNKEKRKHNTHTKFLFIRPETSATAFLKKESVWISERRLPKISCDLREKPVMKLCHSVFSACVRHWVFWIDRRAATSAAEPTAKSPALSGH